MRCIRCATDHPFGDHVEGCPRCLAEGQPANLSARYEGTPPDAVQCELPYPEPVTLGEGQTPLIEWRGTWGCAWLKLESLNPTGSHKDRMAAQTVSRALEAGAREVVAASSGNAGVAVAAYAARAGLRCEVALTPECSALFERAMRAHGARLKRFSSSLERWPYIRERVQRYGAHTATNYMLPPVGSPPLGVEGYKAIAAELLGQAGAAPDVIFVPTSRGDLLWGIHAGFSELAGRGLVARLPRLFAVEPLPRLARVMAGEDWRAQFPGTTAQLSIAGSTVTLQATQALVQSGGRAIVVSDMAARAAQAELARGGVLAELSSASALAAWQQARADGEITDGDTCALIITSSGFKDALPFE